MKLDLNSLTPEQRTNLLVTVHQILDELPPEALYEITRGGYDADVDKLMEQLLLSIYKIYNYGGAIQTGDLSYLHKFEEATHQYLIKHNYNYFKNNVLLGFQQHTRNVLWGNLAELYNHLCIIAQRGCGKSMEFCFAYPLWRLYSYDRPTQHTRYDSDNNMRHETLLITNESKLSKEHMEKIIGEIKINPILKEKLDPDNKAKLGVEGIICVTSSKLHVRTMGSFIRGLHVQNLICDDILTDAALYSKEQRSKALDAFKGIIAPCLDEGGRWLVAGTPFHQEDLYGQLKKNNIWNVFEFPGIYPDGTILAPDRYSFKYLNEIKEEDGNLVFSREHLVSPISDASSIFPMDILNNAIDGMHEYRLVNYITEFPLQFDRVSIGCDFAISGSVAADYTVYTVWGRTSNTQYFLIDYWRKKGASHNEQLTMLANLNQKHQPNKIIIESNNFQILFSKLAQEMGMRNIEEFSLQGFNKKDLKSGWPSLAPMFERYEIRIPYYDKHSKDCAHWLLGEFNSVTFNQDTGKLESTSQHDDGVSSTFMALNDLRENKSGYRAYFAG